MGRGECAAGDSGEGAASDVRLCDSRRPLALGSWPGAEAFLWRDRGRNLVDAGLALLAAHRLHLGVSPRRPGAPW